MNLTRCLAALLIATLPVQLAAAPPHKATATRSQQAPTAPSRDWATVATRLPSGAFLLGNPDAKVHLVEFLSLTCPHCAHFEAEAIPPFIAKYLRPGIVSYEVRHALRDPFDYAGSVLLRCDGPQAFFVNLPRMFAQQNSWFGRAQTWSKIESAEGQTADQALPRMARAAGFDTVLGMNSPKIDSCLANHAETELLSAQANEAWRMPGFQGTPGFMIDDKLRTDVSDWRSLDVALAAALHPTSKSRKTAR